MSKELEHPLRIAMEERFREMARKAIERSEESWRGLAEILHSNRGYLQRKVAEGERGKLLAFELVELMHQVPELAEALGFASVRKPETERAVHECSAHVAREAAGLTGTVLAAGKPRVVDSGEVHQHVEAERGGVAAEPQHVTHARPLDDHGVIAPVVMRLENGSAEARAELVEDRGAFHFSTSGPGPRSCPAAS